MDDFIKDDADWRARYQKINDWDALYENQWADGLSSTLSRRSELPHHAIVAGLVKKLIGHGSLLDAGCGDGALIEYLDLSQFDYVGFDLSATAVKLAQRHDGVRIERCAYADFKPDRQFDVVAFNESLYHVDDPLQTLDKFLGFTNERGIAIVSLYQRSPMPGNGTFLTQYLTYACAKGRYRILEHIEASNLILRKSWQIFALAASK